MLITYEIEELYYLMAKACRDSKEKNKWHEAKHHQCKLIVKAKHRDEYTNDNKAVLDKVYKEVSKHHRDRTCIVCNSCNKLTYGYGIKLCVGESLNMDENVLTERGKDLLTNLLQNHRLRIGCNERKNKYSAVHSDVSEELGHIKAAAEHLLDLTDKCR